LRSDNQASLRVSDSGCATAQICPREHPAEAGLKNVQKLSNPDHAAP